MSEEIRKGGAARYLAMVACVLLGGFVYVGWRIKKGDEVKHQHTLAAGVEQNIANQGLSLSIPKDNNPKLLTDSVDDDDLLSGLTLGSEEETQPQTVDTPDDIDIEALLSAAPDLDPADKEQIGGVAGDLIQNELLPETEEVTQVEVTPPPAPAPEALAQAEASSLPAIPASQPNSPGNTESAIPASIRENASTDSVADIIYRDYKVKRGDTLSRIAQKYLGSRKRATEIYQINKDRMTSPNLLKIGMVIRVPFDRNSNRTSNHRITTTDSLPSIAMRYYGSAEPEIIEGIRLANPILSQGGFREGTRLTIPPLEVVQQTPVEVYASTPAGRERIYVVRPGDTLSRIAARKYGNSNRWRAIFNANKDKIRKPSAIRVGMTLRLP